MSIVLEHLLKRYSGHPVVNDVSLEIADGEFFVLLGSSGSGKSTMLRMIAGLTRHGPGARAAAWPRRDAPRAAGARRRLCVPELRAVPAHVGGRQHRVRPALRKMRRRRTPAPARRTAGTGGAGRAGQAHAVASSRAASSSAWPWPAPWPPARSVAAGRALRRAGRQDPHRPAPRAAHIQRELGITTIFVTHDQEEAFELADRLGVMNFGRLLEVGRPDELYQHPQTEFVATFLGTANLLVGRCACRRACSLGRCNFPAGHRGQPPTHCNGASRVQVLFRPEDVVLADEPGRAGRGAIWPGPRSSRVVFAGAYERLRLRLPPLPGVRPIAPPVPFGDDTHPGRGQPPAGQARRCRCAPASRSGWASAASMRWRTPACSFLLLTDGSPAAQAALALGGQIARLAHARAGVGLRLGRRGIGTPSATGQASSSAAACPRWKCAPPPQPLAEAVHGEAERQPYDLVIMGSQRDRAAPSWPTRCCAGWRASPAAGAACAAAAHARADRVTPGEPGKDDVLFAGRLMRHFGAQATLLSVLPAERRPGARAAPSAFWLAGVRTLAVLGVPAQTSRAHGAVQQEPFATNCAAMLRPAGAGRAAGHRPAADLARRGRRAGDWKARHPAPSADRALARYSPAG